ncbi:MAG: MFS transporter [Gemmatimonadales bacterium]
MSDTGPGEAKAVSSMNIWKSLRGLPRDVWILSGATLINRAGTMVLPFLVLYLTRERGFSASRAGLALAVYGAGSIIASPISGRLADRIGPLPIMRASLLGTGALLLLFPFVHGYPAIIALTLTWALIAEAFRPANMAMIADMVPRELLKPAYALNRLAINLGMSIGPAAAGFIAAKSFDRIFFVDALTTIVAGLILLMTPFALAHRKPSEESPEHSRFRPLVLDDRRMLLFLSALFLTGVVFFQHEGALPLFLVGDLHLSPAFYGMLFTINTLMIVVMEVPLNGATAHWPHRNALSLGALLFALGSGAFAFARSPAAIIVGIVVWTFGEMLLFPQAAAYVADIAPPERRGEYMGAYQLAFSLSFAFAPWAGASGYARFGARPLWLGVFVIGAISALMMLQVTVEKARRVEAAAA